MFVHDPMGGFGSHTLVEVPELQGLLRHIIKDGIEHHPTMKVYHSGAILQETFETYFGWETYDHID